MKQAPRAWHKDIDGKLEKLGFRPCQADPNLYIPTFKNGCLLLLYMNNILLVEPPDRIANVKKIIKPLYKINNLDPATIFLDIKIEQLPDS